LDSSMHANSVGFWDIPVESIWDDVAGSDVLQHFLRHRYPCSWWAADDDASVNSQTVANGLDEDHEDQEIFRTSS